MEINRLTPMKEGYPTDLFNKIYKETTGLRKKLVYQIDHRYYGVSKDIIESWFDDKFIFVFNKHFQEKNPDVLKGFIISSLCNFKNRVLKKAYTREGEFYGSQVSIETTLEISNIVLDESIEPLDNAFLNLCIEYMKDKLSKEAYIIFDIELNPPTYILQRIKNSSSRINIKLLLEFLELEDNYKNRQVINKLKKEIQRVKTKAKEYFQSTGLSLEYNY